MERTNAWTKYDEKTVADVMRTAGDYIAFLNQGKTERECAAQAVEMAKAAGYRDLKDVIREGKALKAGDKVYWLQMNKAVLLFHIGKRPLAEGLNILGAHIDSPRIDLKQNPFYEDTYIAYADTHY